MKSIRCADVRDVLFGDALSTFMPAKMIRFDGNNFKTVKLEELDNDELIVFDMREYKPFSVKHLKSFVENLINKGKNTIILLGTNTIRHYDLLTTLASEIYLYITPDKVKKYHKIIANEPVFAIIEVEDVNELKPRIISLIKDLPNVIIKPVPMPRSMTKAALTRQLYDFCLAHKLRLGVCL